MRLENKVPLVTGGASGIGEETAYLFAREGAKIVIADMNSERGEEVAKKIVTGGRDCVFLKTDVSKKEEVKRMVDATRGRFGRLDILFNNAGIPIQKTALEEIEEDIWDKVMDVNLKSVFLCSKYAFSIMREQGGGVIINTASISGVRPRPSGAIPYVVSKGAVITLTRALALHLAPFNIRVNSISPVATDTPMLPKLSTGGDLNEAKKK